MSKNVKKFIFLKIFLKTLLKIAKTYSRIELRMSVIQIRRSSDLKISDVRIRFVKKDDSKLKAVASVTLDDCFVVHDIKVIEGADGPFIAMPSRKTNNGEFKDIAHPLNTETREELRAAILAAYDEESAKAD